MTILEMLTDLTAKAYEEWHVDRRQFSALLGAEQRRTGAPVTESLQIRAMRERARPRRAMAVKV